MLYNAHSLPSPIFHFTFFLQFTSIFFVDVPSAQEGAIPIQDLL